MCDEARGCRKDAGNFRRVCPINGRRFPGRTKYKRLGYCAACGVNPNKTNANTWPGNRLFTRVRGNARRGVRREPRMSYGLRAYDVAADSKIFKEAKSSGS